jgi:hypothetical protein
VGFPLTLERATDLSPCSFTMLIPPAEENLETHRPLSTSTLNYKENPAKYST